MPLSDHISNRYKKTKKNNNIIEFNKKKQDVKRNKKKDEEKENNKVLDEEPKTQGVPLDNSDYSSDSESSSDSEFEEILISNLKNLKPQKLERQITESPKQEKPIIKKLDKPEPEPKEELTKPIEIKKKKKKPRKVIKKYYITKQKEEPEIKQKAPPQPIDNYVNFGRPIKYSEALRNKILNF